MTNLKIKKKELEDFLTDQIDKGKKLADECYNSSMTTTNFAAKVQVWDTLNIRFITNAFENADNLFLSDYQRTKYPNNQEYKFANYEYLLSKIIALEGFINSLILITEKEEALPTPHKNVPVQNVSISNKVFIIHGHNELIKEKVARTLSQLGLEPIILHEQTNQGKTIIEKFEKNSSDVGFAVALLTADDEGKSKKEKEYQARARQNVVFEMGYFMGKLGRKCVFLLLENGVQQPSDLGGIVYTPLDESDNWKLQLVKELKAANYNVSADKL